MNINLPDDGHNSDVDSTDEDTAEGLVDNIPPNQLISEAEAAIQNYNRTVHRVEPLLEAEDKDGDAEHTKKSIKKSPKLK